MFLKVEVFLNAGCYSKSFLVPGVVSPFTGKAEKYFPVPLLTVDTSGLQLI